MPGQAADLERTRGRFHRNPQTSDELQELRQKRDMIKLQKEIADIEADKEKIPERVAALESRLTALESWCDINLMDAIEHCMYAAWHAADRSEEDAAEAALRETIELKRKS